MSKSMVLFLSILCMASYSGGASFLSEQRGDVTATRFNVTYTACVSGCQTRSGCAGALYHRRYKLCQFLNHPRHTLTPGASSYIKPPSTLQTQTDACINCTNSEECITSYEENMLRAICVTENCPHPAPVKAARTYGNMLSVKSKVKFECIASEDYAISECQRNGSWSSPGLLCVCRPAHVANGSVRLARVGPDLVLAVTTCQDGYMLLETASPVCNITTDTWLTSFDNVCCELLVDNEWQKIFRYQGGTSLAVLDWWQADDGNSEMVSQYCTFRNSTILADWFDAVPLSKVKFNIIKNEQVVAYLIFDGFWSYRLGWFVQSRLLNSSWTDLNQTTELEIFSGHGKWQHFDMIRFFIGKQLDADRCEEDKGWLAISRRAYPCNAPDTLGTRIVYSPLETVTRLSYGSADVADRLEVWITKVDEST